MYRKNVAGQFLCVQLILTASGAVATGLTPTARRCIDGTFAAATGTFTEDGTTGSYKFALSQADTNGDDISFIVTATGAIPVCVNIVTTAGNPSDAVRFGLTALPNAAAEAAGGLYTRGSGAGQINQNSNGQVDSRTVSMSAGVVTAAAVATDAIDADALAADAVAEIQSGLATAANLAVVAGYIDTEVAAIKAKTDNLPADPADASDIAASFSSIAATLTTIASYIDTEVAAIKAKTDSLTFTVAGVVDSNVQRVNDITVTGNGSPGSEWGP